MTVLEGNAPGLRSSRGLFIDVMVLAAVSALLLFATSAVAWVAYFAWKTASPALALGRFRWALLAGGILSVAIAWFGYSVLDGWGYRIEWEGLMDAHWGRASARALGIGVVEEIAKAMPALLLLLARRKRLAPGEGLMFAACAGIGFALGESTLLFMRRELPPLELVARATASPLTHALFAVPWGMALDARFGRSRLETIPLVLMAMLLGAWAHGLYDFLLARPELPSVASVGVVLVLWIYTVIVAERTVTERMARRPGLQPAVSKVTKAPAQEPLGA